MSETNLESRNIRGRKEHELTEQELALVSGEAIGGASSTAMQVPGSQTNVSTSSPSTEGWVGCAWVLQWW